MDYLQGLQAARLQGCTVESDYWQSRDHSHSAAPVATVAPDDRVTPCSVRPFTVNESPALIESLYAARLRQAFTERQAIERQAVEPALVALTAILRPSVARFDKTDYPTMAAALEGLYAQYRQRANEAAALMQRAPHDGRPPMAVRPPSTVAAMQVRYSDRWQSTPHKVSDCYSLHTVPMQRTDAVWITGEWNAAVDRGCKVSVFAAADAKRQRAKSSGRVAPTVQRRKVTAADLPPIFAD